VGWAKVECWSIKAAISLKRVKIEEKLLWRAYIGTHKRSFERYHPRPPMATLSPRLGVSQPQPKTAIAIISAADKATNFRFCTHILRIDGNKGPSKIWEKVPVAVGVLRDSKIFRAPMYRAHRAVIFAVAQLFCYIIVVWLPLQQISNHNSIITHYYYAPNSHTSHETLVGLAVGVIE